MEQASFTQTAITWAMLFALANVIAILMITGITMAMPNGEKLQERMSLKGTAAATLALGTLIALAGMTVRLIVTGSVTVTSVEWYPAGESLLTVVLMIGAISAALFAIVIGAREYRTASDVNFQCAFIWISMTLCAAMVVSILWG